MRQYLLTGILATTAILSFGQDFSKVNYKHVLTKADSIIKSYYGNEIIDKYTLLDSTNSFYMNNEGLKWKESSSFKEILTFQPNNFFINYLFFYPTFQGDTLDISIMINENGVFADQYAIGSSLIKVNDTLQLKIIKRQTAKDIILKNDKSGLRYYDIKLAWNNEVLHSEFNKTLSLKKEKIIWLGKYTDLKKNKTYFIALDAISGKTLWTKKQKILPLTAN